MMLAIALLMFAASNDRLLDAIERVESGGRANVVGDGGKSHGYYQLQKGYVEDALRRRVSDAEYRSICRDRAKSRDVVTRYWQRYCPGASEEVKARTHNGGPSGDRKAATMEYWRRVKGAMR